MFDLVPAQHTPSFLDEQNKGSNGNLYLYQPHTVIQLVEVSPPPPRRISSVINSSSAASSSYSSSSSSASSASEGDDIEDQEEEQESACSSYCSSDFPPEAALDASASTPITQNPLASVPQSQSDSFSRRMKRILVWRELSDSPSSSSSSSVKRKLEDIEEPIMDADTVSHASKRSRSQASSISSHSISSAELNMHPCPACDASFPTLQGLRQHGQRGSSQSNEACCVAVEYAFEQ
ncbi:hypothetical protein M413DRAFT_30153 [Hebeloma cylindrosporum]|uniref:C2H2-type domain-containing protein n=1 Tax=Hebeloma cylindrosporum TaxID=76867 RepID=A0A0C3BNQ7_HEBCY|nr:hypothetical protein M413DRAFT_30153 [Hebeloma cylindrosporum h7]